MFTIQMLPADHGDCLWIEYGTGERTHHVLIDGGTPHSFKFLAERIKSFPGDTLDFELFVITHVDADHIGGSLELMRKINRLGKKIVFGDVWFNGWKHLSDQLGDMQGELVTNHLERRKLPWNKAFEERAAVVPEEGKLPVHQLPGGLRLTLLSPTRSKLDLLRERWEETITEEGEILGQVKDKEKFFEPHAPPDTLGDEIPDVEGLAAWRFSGDKTPANGSSIAFLAEYRDGRKEKRCLFTGDAHVDVLVSSVKRLIAEDNGRVTNGRLRVDALKVSHHGSRKNISKELLDLLDCRKFLFSTSGQQFSHPDREGVARVIKFGRAETGNEPKLYFNYKSEFNKVWDDDGLRFNHGYETEYPPANEEGILVKL